MEWRLVPIAQGFEVSEYGDVRKVGGRRVKGFIDSDGYLRYSLTHDDAVRRAVAAHRLVALAFIGPPPSADHEVAHDNGSRVFCHYGNLRWATCGENHADRVEHGTDAVGERNGRATITEQDVRDIRREYRAIKTRIPRDQDAG